MVVVVVLENVVMMSAVGSLCWKHHYFNNRQPLLTLIVFGRPPKKTSSCPFVLPVVMVRGTCMCMACMADAMDEDFEASTMSDGLLDRKPRKRAVQLPLSLEELATGCTKKLKVCACMCVHAGMCACVCLCTVVVLCCQGSDAVWGVDGGADVTRVCSVPCDSVFASVLPTQTQTYIRR